MKKEIMDEETIEGMTNETIDEITIVETRKSQLFDEEKLSASNVIKRDTLHPTVMLYESRRKSTA